MSTAEDAPLEPNHENMPTNRASVTKTQTTLEIIVKYFFTGCTTTTLTRGEDAYRIKL